jgi:hypothetical protein
MRKPSELSFNRLPATVLPAQRFPCATLSPAQRFPSRFTMQHHEHQFHHHHHHLPMRESDAIKTMKSIVRWRSRYYITTVKQFENRVVAKKVWGPIFVMNFQEISSAVN